MLLLQFNGFLFMLLYFKKLSITLSVSDIELRNVVKLKTDMHKLKTPVVLKLCHHFKQLYRQNTIKTNPTKRRKRRKVFIGRLFMKNTSGLRSQCEKFVRSAENLKGKMPFLGVFLNEAEINHCRFKMASYMLF